MINISDLEKQYLDAKIAYYEGRQLMEDSEFDFIERLLKENGSKVVEQIGSKRKDFDYAHPNKMLSLAKLQTEEGNNMKAEFITWYSKRLSMMKNGAMSQNVIAKPLYSSAKFDGNAINIIYNNEDLYQVLTRGDGAKGKNITDRMKLIAPARLLANKDAGTLEIRCEVVIDKAVFEEKYAFDSANPRNFVAGILGGDEFDEDVVKDLTLVPLHFLLDGENIRRTDYGEIGCKPGFYILDEREMASNDYEDELNYWISVREKFPFQLDGVVFSFQAEYRSSLGENDHDPEWAIAIKFIAEEATTTYTGIEWNVGKTGELAPVVLLAPVQLAGTTVKRASGYNAGFITNKGIGPGAMFSVIKAGDIIPEIKTVIMKCTEPVELPTHCPDCDSNLTFDGIHLMCNNDECPGRIGKILASSLQVLNIKRVGSKTIAPFAADFSNLVELIVWARTPEEGDSKDIEKYGIAHKSRSHEIFLEAFKKIVSLPYAKVIQVLGYTNVGKKLSIQLANEHAGVEYDYAKLEKALVESMRKPEVTYWIKYCVSELERVGIKVDRPMIIDTASSTFVCLTGSPSSAGFGTKKDFLDKYAGKLIECELSNKNCQYLVTNDLASKTSKMTTAIKKGIKIVPYTFEF